MNALFGQGLSLGHYLAFSAVLFCIAVNERQKEFGILSSIGAGEGKISAIIAGEALCIALVGSVAGAALSAVTVGLLSEFLREFSRLPLLYPGSGLRLVLAGKCILAAALSVAVAVAVSCYRMNRTQPYLLVKENE